MNQRNKNVSLFLGLCLLLPALLPGQKSTSLEQDMELLRKYHSTLPSANKGLERVAVRDWQGAESELQRCLAILPGHPNACYGKAVIASQAGDLPAALSWIERAEAGCLELQRVWENQKPNWLSMSREDEKRLRELAAQDIGGSTSSLACVSVDRAYESKKTGRATADVLQDGASPFAIPAEFHALHGNLLFKLRRPGEAEAQYLKALAIEPGHERCLNNLVNLYFVGRRLDQAREWLEQARKRKARIHPRLAQAVEKAQQKSEP